ncbi:MAG: hypothetical protein AAGK09_10590 [Planctomycetota bacterium]
MSGYPDVIDVPLEPDGRVAVSVQCRDCDYDLKGAMPDGQCPECGRDVAWSLVGDLLRFADPRWLGRVRLGALLTVIMVAGYIPGFFLMALIMGAAEAIDEAVGVGVAIVFLVAVVVYVVVALVQFTAPEPGATESTMAARRVARWGMLGAMLVYPVFIVAVIGLMAVDESLGIAVAVVFGLAITVSGITGFIALFYHARVLSMRIPLPWLANQAIVCVWSIVGVYAVMIVAMVASVFALGVGGASGAFSIVGGLVGCVGSAAVLGLFVWAFVLLCVLMVQLGRAKQAAAANAGAMNRWR